MISKVIYYLPAIVALMVFIVVFKLFARCMKSEKVIEKFEEEDVMSFIKDFRKDFDDYQNNLESRISQFKDKTSAKGYELKEKFVKLEKTLLGGGDDDDDDVEADEDMQRDEDGGDMQPDEDGGDMQRDDDGGDMQGKETERDRRTADRERTANRERRTVDREEPGEPAADVSEPTSEPPEMVPPTKQVERDIEDDDVVESFVEGISSCTTANCYRYN